jgi:gluconolactonase
MIARPAAHVGLSAARLAQVTALSVLALAGCSDEDPSPAEDERVVAPAGDVTADIDADVHAAGPALPVDGARAPGLLDASVFEAPDAPLGQRSDTDAGSTADAGAGGAYGLESGMDGGEPDARVPTDAGPRATSPLDAGADIGADASQSDAGRVSAGPLWARICGSTTGWPSPLPARELRTATRLSTERYGFVEGPVWVDEIGALLFTDMDFVGDQSRGPTAQIRRLTPPASFDVFVPSAGSNGLALWDDTTLIAGTHETRSLSLFDVRTGARTELGVTYEGAAFNAPNDLAVRADGTVFFTDPDYQLGPRPRELDKTGLYSVALTRPPSPAARAQLLDDTLTHPNGIALSPDQRTLYVGSAGDEIWRYEVLADGTLRNKTEFARVGGSDGLTVDCAGNLYVTSGTVEVFAPSGLKLGDIYAGEPPANVAFGGADHRTLYITAETSIYAIELGVPGYPY